MPAQGTDPLLWEMAKKTRRVFRWGTRRVGIIYCGLFGALGCDVFAVESGDIAQRNVLGAFGGAGSCVGAVAEAEFVHLAYHGAGAALALYLALGQECELAYLGRYEEHCRAVLAGCHAGAAADTCGGVHGNVGHFLADGEAICVLSAAAVERHVAAGLLDFIECVAVYHKVANHGERGRAPRLDCDGVAVVELAHVELAGSDALNGTVGVSVDVERAHTADAFAAVAVEYYGFFAFLNELLVEHIEHFEEAAACRNVVEVVVDELSFLLGTTLTPNFQIYADCIFHYYM